MLRMCISRGFVIATRNGASKILSRNRSFIRSPLLTLSRRSFHSQVAVQDEETTREVNSRVQKIADEILDLNLLEISDLSNILKEKLGLDQLPMSGVGMMPMGTAVAAPTADAGGGAAPAEAVEEKTAFDVKLEAFDKASKIKVIKEIRAVTELGLKEAKEMVEKAPVVVKTGVDKTTAEEMKKQIEAAGGTVVLE
eukprot:g2482.t1